MNSKTHIMDHNTNERHGLTSIQQLTASFVRLQEENRAEKKKDAWMPKFARFKLSFIYRNGERSKPYHSYDIQPTSGKNFYENEVEGLAKLLRYVNKQRGEYVSAVIYCCLTENKKVEDADYCYCVFKHKHNSDGWSNPLMEFDRNGKLNLKPLVKDHINKMI